MLRNTFNLKTLMSICYANGYTNMKYNIVTWGNCSAFIYNAAPKVNNMYNETQTRNSFPAGVV